MVRDLAWEAFTLGYVPDRLGSGAIALGPVSDRLGSVADRVRVETVWVQTRPCEGLRGRLEASKTVWRCCDSLHRAQA